jgi:hypothetical protein
MPHLPRRRLLAVALVASAAVLSANGCASDPREGYAAANPYSTKYRSVALPIFENRTYVQNVQFELAEALTTQIPASTPYRVTGQNSADTILRGTIMDVSLAELSKDPTTGLSNEVLVKVRVDFEWSDLRTGQPIVARKGFVSSAPFVPSRPAREPMELGVFEVVQQLSRDIVDQMQSTW